MSATVYYDNVNEIATVNATFLNALGQPADPTTVSCIVTDPSGASVTHTLGGAPPADITKVAAGKYSLAVSCSPAVTGADGLWEYEFVGTGTVSGVMPGTWRVLPEKIGQLWYVGAEEMNDRLGITDTADMSTMQTAIAATAGWINSYTGRHFYRLTETRTFQPHNIWMLDVDDIVPGTTIQVNIDRDGDGTFEEAWTQGSDYQLYFGKNQYNMNASGTPRPYRRLQVVNTGRWLPFTWPYYHLDRIQIITTWGWPMVPWAATEANRILAADLFKMKDAPFGIAGMSELGVTRISSNPWLVELLHDFVSGRKVGI